MEMEIGIRNVSYEIQCFSPSLRHTSYAGIFISSPTFSGSHLPVAILVCDKLATDKWGQCSISRFSCTVSLGTQLCNNSFNMREHKNKRR